MARVKQMARRSMSRRPMTRKPKIDESQWMRDTTEVKDFLRQFTDDPVAEAPLKLIIALSSHKNLLRLVSKLFKSHAEEGTKTISWKGPEEEEEEAKPSNLMNLLAIRGVDGRFKDRLPNLKSIECDNLNTLMNLNGCPSGLEQLSCANCPLIKNLIPLAACSNLRKLYLATTNVSNLKPLMGCVKLEWLCITSLPVSDLSPLSACTNLKVLWMSATQVSDLRPLSGLHQLRSLSVEETPVTDLTPLSTLSRLETLFCRGTKVSDLCPLSLCPKLRALDINDTNVKSLTPLLQCKALKYLHHFCLKDKTEEETRGYIQCMQDAIPGLICTTEDDLEEDEDENLIEWFHTLPSQLQHEWGEY